MNKKENIKEHIELVLGNKADIFETSYAKSLEQLVEELKIYQYELEFQNIRHRIACRVERVSPRRTTEAKSQT